MPQEAEDPQDAGDGIDVPTRFIEVLRRWNVTDAHLQHPLDNFFACRNLSAFLIEGCPPKFPNVANVEPKIEPKVEPKLEPTVVELGVLEADYDETIAEKAEKIKDPKCLGFVQESATDANFPDTRTGKKRYRAYAVHFRKVMHDDAIKQWCVENGRIRATAKEGLDLAKLYPRAQLDDVMPLALAGQFIKGDGDTLIALCLGWEIDDERDLECVTLASDKEWGQDWYFLVLEELPAAD